MKKKYFKPETNVVVVELQRMIAMSLTEEKANPEGEVLSRRDGFYDDEDFSGSRRHGNNVWDDEEELDDERW